MRPGRALAAAVVAALAVLAVPAAAQFTGPSARGQAVTVAEAGGMRLGSYVTLTGNVVARLRDDYYTFADATGEMRVEIGSRVWGGREVTPSTPVRLLGEIDRGLRGRYLSVESLEIVP